MGLENPPEKHWINTTAFAERWSLIQFNLYMSTNCSLSAPFLKMLLFPVFRITCTQALCPDRMRSTLTRVYIQTPSYQSPISQKRQHLGGNFQHRSCGFSYILFTITNGMWVTPSALRIFGFDFRQRRNIYQSQYNLDSLKRSLKCSKPLPRHLMLQSPLWHRMIGCFISLAVLAFLWFFQTKKQNVCYMLSINTADLFSPKYWFYALLK